MDIDQTNYATPVMVEQEPVITTKEWLKTFLMLLIPVANLVFMIMWAIGGDGIPLTKRNMFRAYWIMYAILMGVYFVIIIFVMIVWFLVMNQMQ